MSTLKPCPFCAAELRIRAGFNSYGHCPTDGCYANRGQIVPLDDERQVAAWNRRPALSPESLAGGEVQTLRTLLDNLVIAQSLSKEIRTHATDEARAYLYDTRLAALSPEAPARDVGDLEELLATAIAAELEDGGAEVPYSVIAERVAARVADEASAPSCALTAAAEEALSFLQNAPLESGICCCGDPISGHGYGSGHSPVDDLAYHSSQVAEKLQAALTPRHEAPASEGGAS